MFDFQKEFRFTAEVKVQLPTDEGRQERKFTGVFLFVPKKELEILYAEAPGAEDITVLRRTFVGWKDDLTAGGQPLAYSEEAREMLLETQFVRIAVAKAYWDEVSGLLPKN